MSKLIISSSPHVKSKLTTNKIMWNVVLALLPASFAGVYFFGLYALIVILTCVITAIITECIFLKLRKKRTSISGGSAVLTGLLLALILPPRIPIWEAVLGSIVAVVIGKQIFGACAQVVPGSQIRPVPSLDLGNPEMRVWPNRDRLTRLGITTTDLGMTVDALVDGAKASTFRLLGDEIDLVRYFQLPD